MLSHKKPTPNREEAVEGMVAFRTLTGLEFPRFVPPSALAAESFCPMCGAKGVSVSSQVMKSMTDRVHHAVVARDGFWFCVSANCPVAYYDNADETYLTVSEVNKRITVKDPGPDVPVCYCLRVDRKTIVDAVMAGTVRSSEEAKRVTKACTGKACHIVNPAGTCCGDQLRDTVASALAWKGATPEEIAAARAEDPGATCCGRTLSRATAGNVDIAGTASVHGDSCCAIPVASAQHVSIANAAPDESCCAPAAQSESVETDGLAKSRILASFTGVRDSISPAGNKLRWWTFNRILRGQPTPLDQAQAELGLGEAEMAEALAELARKGLLTKDTSGRELTGAMGLTTRPTKHKLILKDRTLYTWCALDAVGIPAGQGLDAVVESTTPDGAIKVRLQVEAGMVVGAPAFHVRVPATFVGERIRETVCPRIEFWAGPATSSTTELLPITIAQAGEIGQALWGRPPAASRQE